MAHKILEVILHPHETLRKIASPVSVFDKEIEKLAHDMIATMYHYSGIGLAANQVDVLKRVFILDVNWRGDPDEDGAKIEKVPEIYINPEILSESGVVEYEEGCLSIPKFYGIVERSANIRVRYQDLSGKTHEADFDDLQAIAFQHELDHLNGVMFFDHLSSFKRRVLLEKYTKAQMEPKKED